MFKFIKDKKLKEDIESLRNEYIYHSEPILKKLLSEGYEIGTTLGLIEKITNYKGEWKVEDKENKYE